MKEGKLLQIKKQIKIDEKCKEAGIKLIMQFENTEDKENIVKKL